MLKAGVVVVHWGSAEDTLQCLASLAEVDYADFETAVVINGPEAEHPRLARCESSSLHMVHLPQNLGYAGGANAGARALMARGAEAILFLNNDTLVTADLLRPLTETIEHNPRAGIVGPVIVYAHEPRRVWFAGGTLHPLVGMTRHFGLNSDVDDCLRQLGDGRTFAFVNGCAMMVRSDLFQRLGGFNERYFHFFDDTDICWRARALDYESIVVPSASVLHNVSASTGIRGSTRLSPAQAYYFTRNRFLFIAWNVPGPQRVAMLAAQIAVLLPYEIVRYAAKGGIAAAGGRLRGMADALRRRAGPRLPWTRAR